MMQRCSNPLRTKARLLSFEGALTTSIDDMMCGLFSPRQFLQPSPWVARQTEAKAKPFRENRIEVVEMGYF
jgi:hypothetical protein